MGTWREVAGQPGSAAAVDSRQHELDRVLRDDQTDRRRIILDACADRDVLDIGCVGHNEALVDSPGWLHAEISGVARRCIGLDLHEEGIRRMRDRGYDAVYADILQPPSAALRERRFDVVIAGELIEHLEAPIALLRFCAEVLRPGGTLIVTTPNPFAPWRARAGQLGIAWENADHLVYIFPSGMMEMAGRTGFDVERISTENQPINTRSTRASGMALAKGVLRRLVSRPSDQPTKNRLAVPLPRTYLTPAEFILFRLRSPRGQSRERVIYRLTLKGAD